MGSQKYEEEFRERLNVFLQINSQIGDLKVIPIKVYTMDMDLEGKVLKPITKRNSFALEPSKFVLATSDKEKS